MAEPLQIHRYPRRDICFGSRVRLLSRYPGITEDESAEILTFLRTGRHLDVGLLTADERLKPNLDAFMADHKSHFQVKWTEAALVIAGIAALIAILWLVLEMF